MALARPHLTDPNFTLRAAAWYGVPDQPWPPQYFMGRDQLRRNSEKDREELTELKLKARPKTRADLMAGRGGGGEDGSGGGPFDLGP